MPCPDDRSVAFALVPAGAAADDRVRGKDGMSSWRGPVAVKVAVKVAGLPCRTTYVEGARG